MFRAQPGRIFPWLVVALVMVLFYPSRFSRAFLFTFICFPSKPHWDEGGASEKLEHHNTQRLSLPNVVATSLLIVVKIPNKVWIRQEGYPKGFSTSGIFQLTLFHCRLCLITPVLFLRLSLSLHLPQFLEPEKGRLFYAFNIL